MRTECRLVFYIIFKELIYLQKSEVFIFILAQICDTTLLVLSYLTFFFLLVSTYFDYFLLQSVEILNRCNIYVSEVNNY